MLTKISELKLYCCINAWSRPLSNGTAKKKKMREREKKEWGQEETEEVCL